MLLEHRGRSSHPAVVGSSVPVGPHAHVNGAVIEDEVFVATGACLFPGSVAGSGSELRIHSVLHVNTRLARGTVVPIGGSPPATQRNCSRPTGTTSCGLSSASSTSRRRTGWVVVRRMTLVSPSGNWMTRVVSEAVTVTVWCWWARPRETF